MAVTDKLKRWGDRNKSFLVGPVTLVGPITDARRKGFASATRIDGAVDVYEITDGIGATEGAYTITIRPYSERGLTAKHRAVGRVALVRQVNGVGNPGAPSTVVGIRSPRDSRSTVTLGPAFILNQDRVFVVIERQDTSTLRYILEVDRIPTLWGLAGSNPSLDLRFAENKSLTDAVSGQNLITFTRASEGTFVNSQGQIQTAAINAPRFDHNPTTGESLGLLVEEQRANVLPWSEGFDDAAWTKAQATVSTNATIAPNGQLTADKLIEDSSNNTHNLYRFQTGLTSGADWTFSVYAKAAERTAFALDARAIGSGFRSVFDLSAKTTAGAAIGSGTLTSTSIQELSNGWFRCSVTGRHPADTAWNLTIRLNSPAGTDSYTGDNASGMFFWGAQLEAGAFPTSYIPTTTSAATRAADVASITGSNFSTWYRQDEGTIYADAFRESAVPSTAFPVIFDARGQPTDIVQASYVTEALAGQYVANNTVTQSELYLTGFVNVRRRRLASAYGTNNFAICGNGNTPSVDSLGTPPSNIASVFIGSALGSPQHLNGTIRRLTYWPQRLPNPTLQTITL